MSNLTPEDKLRRLAEEAIEDENCVVLDGHHMERYASRAADREPQLARAVLSLLQDNDSLRARLSDRPPDWKGKL
jgi:hypothetical protein